MKFYSLVLILIVTSIASGQPQEGNATTNATGINDSSLIASGQPQEENAANAIGITVSSIDSGQPQELNEMSTSAQDNDSIQLDSKVLEVNRATSARFGVGKKEAAKQEMYRISIKNEGDTRITDVIVSAEMDPDMKFESTRYEEESRGRLDVTRDPPDFKEGIKTRLTWDIGILELDETKSILLEAYMKPGANNTNLTVRVTGNALNGIPVSEIKYRAEVANCEHINKFDGGICEDVSDAETCQTRCPDWSIPQ